MDTHADNIQEHKSQSVSNKVSQKQSGGEAAFQFVDNRPETVQIRKLQGMANNSSQVRQLGVFQKMANNYTVGRQNPLQKKENKIIGNTSNTVIQQTPAEWGAAPQVMRMLDHSHGWFSTWKKIKYKINEYIGLLPGALDARRGKLGEIRPLITEWEADTKHTAGSTEQRVIDIRTDMPILKDLIKREYTQIAVDADVITGGHAEIRHGADLTDQQLQDRLTTGLDRSGVGAATDTSSRFASHDLLVSTRNTAINGLNAAKTNTIAHFAALLNDFANKWTIYENTPPGPARGVAGGLRNAARAAIHTAVGNIPLLSPNLLRVTANNPPYGGANPANIPNRVADMIDVRNRYKIVINHGQNLGPSFQGTGPPGGPHPGTALAPPPQSTLTILQAGGVHLSIAPAAANWPSVTHYPVDTAAAPAGISIG